MSLSTVALISQRYSPHSVNRRLEIRSFEPAEELRRTAIQEAIR